MSTSFGVPSVICPATMASASAVSPSASTSFGPASSYHSLGSHMILSPTACEGVDLSALSASPFLANFSSSVNLSSNIASTSPFMLNGKRSMENSTNMNSNAITATENHHKQETTIPVDRNPISVANLLASASINNCETTMNENRLLLPTECDDSSQSSSTQSSSDNNGPISKRRRRGENQILMEDLISLDRTLEITNIHKQPESGQCGTPQLNTPTPVVDAASNQNNNNSESKRSTEDSPAFRLRPRRSHKSGYNSSGSASPSPINSPMKRSRTSSNSITQKLLRDTSRQLLQLTTQSTNNVDDIKSDKVFAKPKPRRSCHQSVLRNVDVSVFAELITPMNLIESNSYANNYIAMRIVDIEPLRYVHLMDPTKPQSAAKIITPLLRLHTIDLEDRFSLQHARGVFDDNSLSQTNGQRLSVYLLGTYATKGHELAEKGHVISIVKFRTSISLRGDSLQDSKRKLLLNGDSNFAFGIIVDSPGDEPISNPEADINMEIKQEIMPEEISSSKYSFAELFKASPRSEQANDSNWLPLVSFSTDWRAPDDPKELNKTLYILQPCIPKFESASRTVKM